MFVCFDLLIFFQTIYLDDVLGIPSSATTDSNNSNETGGSPCSSTSGSPAQSPLLNCSNTVNNSNESTSADYSDKKKQSDTSLTKVTVGYIFLIPV